MYLAKKTLYNVDHIFLLKTIGQELFKKNNKAILQKNRKNQLITQKLLKHYTKIIKIKEQIEKYKNFVIK